MTLPYPLVLGSQSPRRKELLSLLGLPFTVVPADIDETPNLSIDTSERAVDIAFRKATKIQSLHPDKIVITADTMVFLQDLNLAKPQDKVDALEMLLSLSGRTHHVYTGVAIVCPDRKPQLFTEGTRVTFRTFGADFAQEYIERWAPYDKAGAYGIQDDYSHRMVESIYGSLSNVIGLPMVEVERHLLSLAV